MGMVFEDDEDLSVWTKRWLTVETAEASPAMGDAPTSDSFTELVPVCNMCSPSSCLIDSSSVLADLAASRFFEASARSARCLSRSLIKSLYLDLVCFLVLPRRDTDCVKYRDCSIVMLENN